MDLLKEQLSRSKTIAIVWLSPNPDRPSHYVAKHLQEQRRALDAEREYWTFGRTGFSTLT